MMKVEVETVDPVRRRLAVEVPVEDVRSEMERAYGELGRRAQVRGFRPGRTPRQVIERMFGDQVRAEVFAKLIQRSYADALREHGLIVVSDPEIVTEQAEPGVPLRYSATVEVRPEVLTRNYAGLDAERRIPAVSDADVDEFLGKLQESLTQLRPIADRTRIERGDVVTLDYEARIAQRLVGRAQSRLVEIGGSSFSESFDTELEGTEVGTTREIDVTYPDDYADAEVAGQTVTFRVTTKALSAKDVPPLNDDFAKDHGECDTLPDLRQRVRRELEEQVARRADEAVRGALVEQLVKAHDDIVIPDAMVQRRAQAMAEELIQSRRDPHLRPKDEAAQRASLASTLEPQARAHVKAALLLDSIAQQEHLEVSDAALESHIQDLVARAGNVGERLRALYQDPEAREGLRARLLHQNALDLVVARANIVTVAAEDSVADTQQNG
jgi:trigger factor